MWVLDKQSCRVILGHNSWECVFGEGFGEREREGRHKNVAVECSLQNRTQQKHKTEEQDRTFIPKTFIEHLENRALPWVVHIQ